MFCRHRTPEQWHLPTLFRDSSGGRITIPVSRPSLYAIPFLIGLGNTAAWLLSAADLQNHVVARAATYTLCAGGAWTASRLTQRYIHEERFARACGGGVFAACWFADVSWSRDPLLLATLATVVLTTVAGEVAFQVSARLARRRGGAAGSR